MWVSGELAVEHRNQFVRSECLHMCCQRHQFPIKYFRKLLPTAGIFGPINSVQPPAFVSKNGETLFSAPWRKIADLRCYNLITESLCSLVIVAINHSGKKYTSRVNWCAITTGWWYFSVYSVYERVYRLQSGVTSCVGVPRLNLQAYKYNVFYVLLFPIKLSTLFRSWFWVSFSTEEFVNRAIVLIFI